MNETKKTIKTLEYFVSLLSEADRAILKTEQKTLAGKINQAQIKALVDYSYNRQLPLNPSAVEDLPLIEKINAEAQLTITAQYAEQSDKQIEAVIEAAKLVDDGSELFNLRLASLNAKVISADSKGNKSEVDDLYLMAGGVLATAFATQEKTITALEEVFTPESVSSKINAILEILHTKTRDKIKAGALKSSIFKDGEDYSIMALERPLYYGALKRRWNLTRNIISKFNEAKGYKEALLSEEQKSIKEKQSAANAMATALKNAVDKKVNIADFAKGLIDSLQDSDLLLIANTITEHLRLKAEAKAATA